MLASAELSPRQASAKLTLQSGVSLLELLIAMAISLVVSLAMIVLMANTLSTGTNTIKMTRLTAEMRAAMQIMTRDLRRANFFYDATKCYAATDCTVPDGVKGIQLVDGSCFEYWYKRYPSIVGIVDPGISGAFRLDSVDPVLQMKPDGDCSPDGDWVPITDPRVIKVTGFQLVDAGYSEDISKDHTQWVSKIRITMQASLIAPYRGIPASRTIEDFIYVRNNVFCPDGVCP